MLPKKTRTGSKGIQSRALSDMDLETPDPLPVDLETPPATIVLPDQKTAPNTPTTPPSAPSAPGAPVAALGAALLGASVDWDGAQEWSKTTFGATVGSAHTHYRYPSFECTRLVRIELDPAHTLRYEQYKRRLESDGAEPNEVYLYHGSPLEASLDQIAKVGFDLGLIGKTSGNRGWYGAGIYGSQNAGAVIRYTFWNQPPASEGKDSTAAAASEKRILVCRALLGKTLAIPDNSCEFIGKPCETGYHSHKGKDRWDPDVQYVVFDSSAIQPILFLHFK